MKISIPILIACSLLAVCAIFYSSGQKPPALTAPTAAPQVKHRPTSLATLPPTSSPTLAVSQESKPTPATLSKAAPLPKSTSLSQPQTAGQFVKSQPPTSGPAARVTTSGQNRPGTNELPASGNAQPAGNPSGPTFAAGTYDEDVPVPRGARLPAAIMDEAEIATAEQADATDGIANDFLDEISSQPRSPAQGETAFSSASNTNTWETARLTADERYRILHGDEAYNHQSMNSAREALSE